MSTISLDLDLFAHIIVFIKQNPSSWLSSSKGRYILCFYYVMPNYPPWEDAPFFTFTNGIWTCLKFHPFIPYHLFLPISLSTSLPNPRPSREGGRLSIEGFLSLKYVERKSWAHSRKPQTCPLFEHSRQFLLRKGMPCCCCMLASLLHVDCWLSCIWVKPPSSFFPPFHSLGGF